jgi:hypothetical protein
MTTPETVIRAEGIGQMLVVEIVVPVHGIIGIFLLEIVLLGAD